MPTQGSGPVPPSSVCHTFVVVVVVMKERNELLVLLVEKQWMYGVNDEMLYHGSLCIHILLG